MAEANYDPFSGFMDAPVPKKKPTSKEGGIVGGKAKPAPAGDGGWMVYSAPKAQKLPTKRQKRVRDVDDEAEAGAAPANAEEWRKEHNITLDGDFQPEPFLKFSKLPPWTKQLQVAFAAQGFTAPTPIQSQAWPIVLAGRDIVGIAKTGSGKTLAFMVPAVRLIQETTGSKAAGPKVLVLAPTRELAQQIQEESNKVLPPSAQAVCIFGGTPKRPQAEELRKLPEVVVATPGRLIDFVTGKVVLLDSVQYLVLDEADRMLDMGFEPQVREICSKIPEERQTMMFSATWPKEVQKLAQQFQKDIVQLHIGSTELRANPDITQRFIFVNNDMEKVVEVRKVISTRTNCRVMIFVNMKATADYLDQQLRRSGIDSQAIHGEKDQAQRDYILHRFKQSKSGVLVATDVAARGIDIKNLEVVVNFDFPGTLDDYVHRIGRTGRAGAKGLAITVLGQREKSFNSHVALRLTKLLENAGQQVPAKIQERADMAALVTRPCIRTNGKGNVIKYKHSNKPSTGAAKPLAAKKDGPKVLFGQKIK